MTDDDLIRVRLEGSRTDVGAIDLDALLAFGEYFRRALRAVAREHRGDHPVLSGHPTSADEQASSLRLLGITEGSAVLQMEPTSQELFASVMETISDLSQAVGTADLSEPVHQALTSAVRSLGDGGSLAVTAPNIPVFRVDAAWLAAVQPRSAEAPPGLPPHVDGWLHAVDFSPDDFRVLDTEGTDWRCRFEGHLKSMVRDLLDAQVRVTGELTVTGSRHRIHVATVKRLTQSGMPALGIGQSADETIQRAMEAAGITGPQPLNTLRQDVDAGEPEEITFDQAIASLRQR